MTKNQMKSWIKKGGKIALSQGSSNVQLYYSDYHGSYIILSPQKSKKHPNLDEAIEDFTNTLFPPLTLEANDATTRSNV